MNLVITDYADFVSKVEHFFVRWALCDTYLSQLLQACTWQGLCPDGIYLFDTYNFWFWRFMYPNLSSCICWWRLSPSELCAQVRAVLFLENIEGVFLLNVYLSAILITFKLLGDILSSPTYLVAVKDHKSTSWVLYLHVVDARVRALEC